MSRDFAIKACVGHSTHEIELFSAYFKPSTNKQHQLLKFGHVHFGLVTRSLHGTPYKYTWKS